MKVIIFMNFLRKKKREGRVCERANNSAEKSVGARE